MAQSQFSLLWNAHKKNLSNGLSTLQQNGEFVDMTLAADGHLVKVHQIVIALASPYLKKLIMSADCPHPVIFLNKISYTTLCAILEYVYTGEVLVSTQNFNEFLQAGKELHIKGLEDMNLNDCMTTNLKQSQFQDNKTDCDVETLNDDLCYFEAAKSDEVTKYDIEIDEERLMNTNEDSDGNEFDSMTEYVTSSVERPDPNKNFAVMQYTVSNQGSLQMILNRYIYYLKHTNKNNTRYWRCVDYVTNTKCPAVIITKGEAVLKRVAAHIHPYHDKRILKKVRDSAVYTALKEAEQNGKNKKKKLNDERHNRNGGAVA